MTGCRIQHTGQITGLAGMHQPFILSHPFVAQACRRTFGEAEVIRPAERGGAAQLQQEHRLAVEVADAVLAQYVDVLALEPVAGKQRAVVIEQKAFRAARHGPAAGLIGVQYCSGPA